MINMKSLRESVRSLIMSALELSGVADIVVAYGDDSSFADRYIVFVIDFVTDSDGRQQIDLEVNSVGPDNQSDDLEQASIAVREYLDRKVIIDGDFAYYVYKSTFNRIDDSDTHTARFRFNFDLYLYDRKD